MRFLLWIFGFVVFAVMLYGTHRFLLALERRGYIYYREKPRGGGMSGAMLEMDKLTRPSVEHTIQAQDVQVESQQDDGE